MNTLEKLYPHLPLFPLEQLKTVLLFGSRARGDETPESDIDLLLIARSTVTEPLRDEIRKACEKIESVLGKRVDWMLADAAMTDLPPELRAEALADGIILFSRNVGAPSEGLDLVPFRLIAYETARVKPLARARLNRDLFGYRSRVRHGRKTYRYSRTGALARSGGFRVDYSVLLCPAERCGEIFQVLRKADAAFTDRLIYLERFEGESLESQPVLERPA